MEAVIVAVGSELLGGDRLDSNSLRLTRELERNGVRLRAKMVVGDREAEIAEVLDALPGSVRLVLVGGGLGPTADDVTREALARHLGRRLVFVPEIAEGIAAVFRRFGREMPKSNERQAWVVEGAEVLDNRRGTAPGLALAEGERTYFLLPGVPGELEGMIRRHLGPWLAERGDGSGRETATLKVACLAESEVEERIAPAYEELGREAVTVLASPGEIRVRLTADGSPEARRERLAAMADRVAELVGAPLFARDEATTLEAVVGELLAERGETLSSAESCTGGGVAERVTAVPGSSRYFVGGAVVYSDELKRRLLGVPEDLLAAHGAVSEPVARAMAEGCRERLASDWAVAITGVAGPGGGSEEKPVGTVHLALAGGGGVTHRRLQLPGDRERVRRMSGQFALEMLRRALLAAGGAER